MNYERLTLTMKDVDAEIRRRIASRIGETDLQAIRVTQETWNAYDPIRETSESLHVVQAEMIRNIPSEYRLCHAQSHPWLMVFERPMPPTTKRKKGKTQ